ncbi:MAG: L,D-transpeptidase [Alkalinema sp. RU_4_3]|nr:L,D-transpeptidase [Alkalinema sp. RU_4_3]
MVGPGQSARAQEPSAPRPTEPSIFNTPGNILPTLGDAGTYLPEMAPVEDESKVVKLVLKRSERRVYVYEGEKVVSSYRVAVGKAGWETPLGTFKVLNMEENPIFKSFKSGRIIEPGPDNPLGVRWIGIWTNGKTQLGFHGTNEPELIGQAVSHGCIRMHNKDVTKLYNQVKEGTVVTVVP